MAPEGKRPITRPRLRWKNNIKTDLTKGGMVWTELIGLRRGIIAGLL
jgi:hypothetical protein